MRKLLILSMQPKIRLTIKEAVKKGSLNFGIFYKGGGRGEGRFQGDPKVLGHLLCTNNFGI